MPDVLQIGAARLTVCDGLDDYDRAFVPSWDEDFQVDDDLLEAVAISAADDLPALIVGPAGCGKTSLVRALGAICNAPVRRVNMKNDMRSSHFLGEKVVDIDLHTNAQVVLWRDGVLPEAMRRGHWLLVDEIDACPAGILMVLQSVLEPGHPLCLAENHGEIVQVHPDFRIFATANTLGHGDESGLYAGTQVLNEATLDRFAITVRQGYLSADREIEVLSAKAHLPPDVAAQLVQIAGLVRNGSQHDECACTFSTRRLIAWGQLSVRLGRSKRPDAIAMARAFRLAVANKLNDGDADYVANVVQRVLGVSVAPRPAIGRRD